MTESFLDKDKVMILIAAQIAWKPYLPFLLNHGFSS